MPFHSVHCGFERLMFSLRGQSNELDFINQTIDFVGFPFKVYRSTGVSVGAVEALNRWLHKHWTRRLTTCAYAHLCAAKNVRESHVASGSLVYLR